MTPILTAAEMRAAEDRAIAGGTDVETLMVRAGAGVAEAAWRFSGGMDTLVICGPGNNGGDGYVIATMLQQRGVKVRVAALGDPRTKAARGARAAWGGPVETLAEADPAPLLIDALFGTGLKRGLDQAVAANLARLAAGASLRIAVDLPSGAGSDDGALLSPIPDFDMTVALGSRKPSHLLQPAARHIGRLVVADIGLGAIEARTTLVERPRLRVPGPDAHKYSRGAVGVVGGAMWGAAVLAASAAQKAGAGSVTLSGVDHAGPAALIRKPEDALIADARLGALVIGPGLGRDKMADQRLGRALASRHRLVLDADALTLIDASIGRLKRLSLQPILTPHEGEFLRLFGDLRGSKIENARFAAEKASAIVVFKGADTVIAAPDGRVAVALPGPSWLASAGTGDVLAGIVAAMLAQGLEPFEAAQAAVWLHAEAGRRAGPFLIADDLITSLPGAVSACL
jgi:ADP-dependent NAD(P)H-hydrate dehydratase / NAD(P)H-hydrate epimerase